MLITLTDLCTQSFTTPLPTSSPPLPDRDELSLPTSILPLHYDLSLRPHFTGSYPASFYFNGTVLITFTVTHATSSITLHAKYLNITRASINVTSSNEVLTVRDVTSDTRLEFFTIELLTNLEVGSRGTVELQFMGNIGDDLAGLYYSSYSTSLNATRCSVLYLL